LSCPHSPATSAGALLMAAAMAGVLVTVDHFGEELSSWWLAPSLALGGIATGMVAPTLVDVTLAGVHGRDAGSASGVLNSALQLGGAIGVALIHLLRRHRLGGLGPGAPRLALVRGRHLPFERARDAAPAEAGDRDLRRTVPRTGHGGELTPPTPRCRPESCVNGAVPTTPRALETPSQGDVRCNEVRSISDRAADYRGTFFYDLAKTTPHRIALALARELADHQATAVSLSPGWIRSEAMLEHFGGTEDNWRDGTAKDPHFCITETPHCVARASVAFAADPDKARFNGQSLASWDLGPAYGVTDLDETQPHFRRYHREVMKAGKLADDTGYR
jgi:hypothetical protein